MEVNEMKKLPLSLFSILCFFAILIGGSYQAHAASIYVDLGTWFGTPSLAYGGPAGVAGTWNGIIKGTTSNLQDITGTVTSVSVTVTASSDTGHDNPPGDTDYKKLFYDYIYSYFGNSWTVAFSGLSNGPYNVYLCAPSTWVPTGAMVVNGSPVSQIVTGYTIKSTQVSVGTLTVTGTGSGSIGLAGVQICAVPLPPSLVLLISGFIGVIGVRRKFKK
jgi:hypothetical protein